MMGMGMVMEMAAMEMVTVKSYNFLRLIHEKSRTYFVRMSIQCAL